MGPEIRFWCKCLIAALAAGGVSWYSEVLAPLDEKDLRAAAAVVSQISATMLGFVLAALAVLTTVTGSKLLRNMQKTGHFRVLLSRMFSAIITLGTLSVFTLGLLFAPQIKHALVYVIVGGTSLVLVSLYDVMRKFWMVLSRLQVDP